MALLYRMGTGNGSGGDLKPFIINFTCHSGFIGKTVTMEFQGTPHAGETVDNVSGTVASDGTLTLYPMHDGLWKYYATSDLSGYQEGTITLEKWGNYPVELKDTLNGATVTPTDDVQTWLHCANIWDKQYTTVSQVVADKTTLNALVQNENANDYLVRSTTFSTTLCENNANNEAMYYLGLYDGCANKLLADDYWSNAICSADVLLADGQTHLFEKVLNVKVPRMISNTSPRGTVSSSTEYEGKKKAYYAFDGIYTDKLDAWFPNSGAKNNWIKYDFEREILIKKSSYIFNLSKISYDITIKIQGSKDNNVWDDLGEIIIPNESSGEKKGNVLIPSNEKYRYIRYYTNQVISANGGISVYHNEIQYYGREEA